jgi:hypothetical protein
LVKAYLHDCEEYVSADSDATFAVGLAQFSFRDFLRPHCREIKLRSDVFPMKKLVPDNTNVLDLNTTARKNDKVIDKASPYMTNMTYFVLKADLAFAIGTFDEKKALADSARTAINPALSSQGPLSENSRVGSANSQNSGRRSGRTAF